MGAKYGRPVGLGDVPGSHWDALAALPVHAVWLMGVWQRSPIGRAVALDMPQLRAAYRSVLSDVQDGDVVGSPYCVRDYVVDERFGGPDGLAAARQELAERDVALILDYVPNHVAADHPWVTDRPDYFLAGSEAQLAAHPEEFMEIDGLVLAKGRDPYFEPWQDVLQLNAFSPELREAAARSLSSSVRRCAFEISERRRPPWACWSRRRSAGRVALAACGRTARGCARRRPLAPRRGWRVAVGLGRDGSRWASSARSRSAGARGCTSGRTPGRETREFPGTYRMEPTGFEPVTSCLQSRRSPN